MKKLIFSLCVVFIGCGSTVDPGLGETDTVVAEPDPHVCQEPTGDAGLNEPCRNDCDCCGGVCDTVINEYTMCSTRCK